MYDGAARRRRLSPLMLLGISVPLLLVLISATVFVVPRLRTHAAGLNGDCTLIVPANPLSAQGLATPYQLVATDPANGACNEANPNQAAFVQGAVFDPATGQISIYNPLIIDQGTVPAAQPVVPQLPAQGIVALWFGSNGNNLTLQATNGSLQQGRCVNGANGTIFGQFAYCNAPRFFAAATRAIHAGRLVPPPLGTAKDGMPCPTVRDFGVVDMDQSDNVVTQYLVTADGKTAQMNAANIGALQGAKTQVNASDNRLLAIALDGALGCTPWMAPDLADPGHMVPALPLNELQAASLQRAPMAQVPLGDPMVLNNNQPDLNKLNAYRRGVDQRPVQNMNQASTKTYCADLAKTAPARMQADAAITKARPSPAADVANSLFTFLAQRFVATFDANGLNCAALLKQQDPVTVTTDANGVATDATINGGNGGGGNGGGGNGTPPNCSVNGTAVTGCTGTVMINGQSCTLAFDNATQQVTITCGQQQPGPGGQPQPKQTPPAQQQPNQQQPNQQPTTQPTQ
ncbi:MAG: hypothetical protein H0W02_17160 [Ktedonobacteraceae bacterium]|nr:hypothetical protein [Ktedonobacteraceae bacterium]